MQRRFDMRGGLGWLAGAARCCAGCVAIVGRTAQQARRRCQRSMPADLGVISNHAAKVVYGRSHSGSQATTCFAVRPSPGLGRVNQ